jgi:hypothetical protein
MIAECNGQLTIPLQDECPCLFPIPQQVVAELKELNELAGFLRGLGYFGETS